MGFSVINSGVSRLKRLQVIKSGFTKFVQCLQINSILLIILNKELIVITITILTYQMKSSIAIFISQVEIKVQIL
eukprot:01813.XXX_145_369_1 [CDS] Oithona nana genome sequencing.